MITQKTRSQLSKHVLALLTIVAMTPHVFPSTSASEDLYTHEPYSNRSSSSIDQQSVNHLLDAMRPGFEANTGKFENGVRFVSRVNGYNVSLTATEAIFSFGMPPEKEAHLPS